MTDDTLPSLRWLPRSPPDFDQRLRAIDLSDGAAPASLRALSSYALDDNQLAKVARAITKLRVAGASPAPLVPFKLGIISNSTTEFLSSAITGTAPRFGLALECVSGSYDQALQDSIDPTSAINSSNPKAVLIGLDWRGLGLRALPAGSADPSQVVDSALQRLVAIRAGIRSNSGAVCIVQTVAAPPERVFGSLDAAVSGSLLDVVRAVNAAIVADVRSSGDILFDVASLAESVGLANWHDPAQWNLAKLPFASEYLPLFADHLCRLIASMLGRAKRCLVLDLDNTLWGGVIGDDGLAGIQLAQGDAAGEAFLALQRYVLALRERGIVLAVSSKNDDAVARAPFREHPEMLLREQHIAVFQANWRDKATNIAAIAQELSLGLESFVFVDDNPFERTLVRSSLPEVAVPEMPEDPALFARTLSAAGYFELSRLSGEDLSRADFYVGNAKRADLQKTVGNLDEYLASLRMEIIFQPFDDVGRARISQLINKSNQFNLTTRRYTEADVAAIAADPSCFTLQVRLVDTFGDNGMISVVICRGVGGDEWTIDTWLMSCRVLGRKVENMVLREMIARAVSSGASSIVGTYIPTPRNGLVEQHYAQLGFTLIDRDPEGTTNWRIPATPLAEPAPPMVVTRSGFIADTQPSA